MGGTIFAVHTDERLRAAARDSLKQAGHAVYEAADLPGALRLSAATRPDLILLPWVALKPVRDALQRLREHTPTAESRTIIWAADDDMPAVVTAFEFGADDCLGIPFGEAELLARVSACLRRPAAAVKPDQLEAGPLVLDKAVHCLFVQDQPVDLAPAAKA